MMKVLEVNVHNLEGKTLVGSWIEMNLDHDRTFELWRGFMPNRMKIPHRSDSLVYSVQVYPESYDLSNPDFSQNFRKWAAVEVDRISKLFEPMSVLEIPDGLYAVFNHHGPARQFIKSWNNFCNSWLANSCYVLDHRPFFEKLNENYKPDDTNATEEVWVPIKEKSVSGY